MKTKHRSLFGLVVVVSLITACMSPPLMPSGQEQPTIPPSATSAPAATGSGAGPAAPNKSTVTAKLVAVEKNPRDGSSLVIQALILTSTATDGMLDSTAGLVGKRVGLVTQSQEMKGWGEGTTFRADVVFVGGEQGGQYHMSNIQKLGP
ncbi:MAG: hypothetical protein M1132_03320 [Chloroflexi bacterium]|nr:hypothetical protein [Chloroflexota bacterium]